MPREGLEIADVFRHFGPDFLERHGASLSSARRRAMRAIERCRTAALGGHLERCGDCGYQRVAYNSCLMGKFSNGESARVSGQFFVESWLFSSAMARLCTSSCPHKSDLPGATLGLAASS